MRREGEARIRGIPCGEAVALRCVRESGSPQRHNTTNTALTAFFVRPSQFTTASWPASVGSSAHSFVQIAVCAGRRVFAPLHGAAIGTSDERDSAPFGFTRARDGRRRARKGAPARRLRRGRRVGRFRLRQRRGPQEVVGLIKSSSRPSCPIRREDHSALKLAAGPRCTSPRAPPRRRPSRPSRPAPAFPSPTSRSSTRRYPTSA